MSNDIDPHITAKYEIKRRLGKGVICQFLSLFHALLMSHIVNIGIRILTNFELSYYIKQTKIAKSYFNLAF